MIQHPAFELLRQERIDELNFNAEIYRHRATGAELLYIPCEDRNKVFTAAFATHPEDDSGVAHIIEHSVLSGSEKYPLREPFVTLMKGSLNTFLNAMTFPDKTLYPFASQNTEDFFNLMNVYLDAVFNPIIYREPLILRQEGWHFELDEKGEPYFTGVVYNEMKGAMSGPTEIISEAERKCLYDNLYRHNSGGNPEAIPTLTDEAFLAFHRRFYHPSNCKFYLYGDVDAERACTLIDDYIKSYERSTPAPAVPLTSKLNKAQYQTIPYASQDGSGFAGLSLVCDSNDDAVKNMLLSVAANALFGLESSPARRILLESGLCQDLMANYDDAQVNGSLSVVLAGTREQDPKVIEKAILEAIEASLTPELDAAAQAALNGLAFTLMEGESGNYPKGLVYGFNALLTWANGLDPIERLRYKERLEQTRRDLADGRLKDLIRQYFLENQHRCTTVLVADEGVQLRMAEAERERAKKAWAELPAERRAAIPAENEALIKRQTTPDSPETLALLPAVHLQDIERQNKLRDCSASRERFALADGSVSENELLYFPTQLQDISYLTLNFPLKDFAEEDLFSLSILTDLLGSVDTARRSYADLTNLALSETGGISCGLSYFPDRQFMTVNLKVLTEKIDQGLEILHEVLRESRFDDHDRLGELLMMGVSRMQMDIIGSGSRYAAEEVAARFDREARAASIVGGFSYFASLLQLLQSEPETVEHFSAYLAEALARIVRREGLVISLCASEASKSKVLAALPKFLSNLPQGDNLGHNIEIHPENHGNPAYIMPSQVQYVAMGGPLNKEGESFRFKGQYHVLNSLLSKDYLWNAIRVRGGAYGASAAINRQGNFLLSSYRDPNCAATIENYKKIPDYLRQLEVSPAEMEGYIIGSMATFDQPYSDARQAQSAFSRYFKGISLAELQKEREELLNCKVEDLRAMAEEIEAALAHNAYCVFGGEAKIREDEAIFDGVQQIM